MSEQTLGIDKNFRKGGEKKRKDNNKNKTTHLSKKGIAIVGHHDASHWVQKHLRKSKSGELEKDMIF